MKVGTKSLLFGVHQFALHPLMVAIAWWRLYGFPWDPRIWVAFLVHDWGYWGKPEMDGPQGKLHPILGATIMHWLFDWPRWRVVGWKIQYNDDGTRVRTEQQQLNSLWCDLCLYHSRWWARRDKHPYSMLCIADKLAIVVTPTWLYLMLAWISGELAEYMANAKRTIPNHGGINVYERRMMTSDSARDWLRGLKSYKARWCEEHK